MAALTGTRRGGLVSTILNSILLRHNDLQLRKQSTNNVPVNVMNLKLPQEMFQGVSGKGSIGRAL